MRPAPPANAGAPRRQRASLAHVAQRSRLWTCCRAAHAAADTARRLTRRRQGNAPAPNAAPEQPIVHWREGAWRLSHYDQARLAEASRSLAARLRAGLEGVSGVTFTQPTQANGVFAILPPGVADELRKSFRFYDWNNATGEVRWMCAWDTTEDDVDAFIDGIKAAVA